MAAHLIKIAESGCALKQTPETAVTSDYGVSLTIGHPEVARLVQKIINPSMVATDEEKKFSWNRDHVVVLLDGDLLVPCLVDRSWSFGPITTQVKTHFCYPQIMNCGDGLVKHLIPPGAKRLKYSTTSCIEGGNVKFFRFGERIGALIGAGSVIFTSQYMERNSLFPAELLKRTEDAPEQTAQIIINFITKKIADDLNVEQTNLLVMKHKYLHIDLELLLDSDNKVYLFNPHQALEALELTRRRSFSIMTPNLDIDAQQAIAEKYERSGIFDYNKGILEKFGFQVIGIPGLFYLARHEDGAPYMNGLLFNDPLKGKKILLAPSATATSPYTYIKPDYKLLYPYSHITSEPFSQEMKKHGISVVYIDCQGVTGGALHCLTREERKNWQLDSTVPQVIPFCSDHLPVSLPTQLQVVDTDFEQEKKQISLITTDPASGETKSQILTFDKFGICNLEIPVPLEGRMNYSMVINGSPVSKSLDLFLLPGHPQIVYVVDLLEYMY